MKSWIVHHEYHGFKLERREYVAEVDSEAFIFRHKKNGARLLALLNDDDN
ncbi:MAG TPA: hypothetical protein GX717_04910, partial [Clostridiaceae bacterium]|nr:hypothetical protein [Clostridiaceae bacterium]